MILTEHDDGQYRIYAGAMEGTQDDGYIAAVVVCLRPTVGCPAREAFRDDALACGHRWLTTELALAYALIKGRAAADLDRKDDRILHSTLSEQIHIIHASVRCRSSGPKHRFDSNTLTVESKRARANLNSPVPNELVELLGHEVVPEGERRPALANDTEPPRDQCPSP